jgi:hypothetical protein
MSALQAASRSASSEDSMSGQLAPVIVFAYARADHLRRCVESLLANPEAERTDVTFFCDGPRDAGHIGGVEAVRSYVETITGFRSVRRVFREQNLGLSRSIIGGVTQALAESGRVIVLEDDLELSPHFLRFMNEALVRYRDDSRVASVHGYVYRTGEPLSETFFLRGADCWGWATWERAWRHYRSDGADLLAQLKARRLCHAFDFEGTYPFTRMLDQQIKGHNDSWAVRWHASCYVDGLLTLYPGRSLVRNIGNDASGTHAEKSDDFAVELSPTPISVCEILVEPSAASHAAFAAFFKARRTTRSRLRQLVYSLSGR